MCALSVLGIYRMYRDEITESIHPIPRLGGYRVVSGRFMEMYRVRDIPIIIWRVLSACLFMKIHAVTAQQKSQFEIKLAKLFFTTLTPLHRLASPELKAALAVLGATPPERTSASSQLLNYAKWLSIKSSRPWESRLSSA
jgi:hypothetical protein